jgi:hypothetical protein
MMVVTQSRHTKSHKSIELHRGRIVSPRVGRVAAEAGAAGARALSSNRKRERVGIRIAEGGDYTSCSISTLQRCTRS